MCIFTNVGDDECFGEGGKRKSAFLYIKKAKITKRSKGEKKREKRQKREHTIVIFNRQGHI